MKKKRICFWGLLLVILHTFCGCKNNSMFEKLVLVDSLLDVNSVDSAQQILSQIQQSKFIDEEQGAYCNLLATRLAYVKYEPNISLSPLNSSIAYFSQKRDKEKLARGYFYKGAILYEQGIRKEAIVCYKKCEKLAETLKDVELQYKVYNILSIANSKADEYSLAREYARKCFNLAMNTGDKAEMAEAYNRIAVSFYNMKQYDSARIYINKCIPLLNNIPSKDRVLFYDNIGFLNIDANPNLAFKYLNMAMTLGPSSDTYDNLAQLYVRQGKKTKADSLWNQALHTEDVCKKSQIVEGMLKYKQKEGDMQEVSKLALSLIALKDSVAVLQQDEKIKELQMQFDQNIEQVEQKKERFKMICMISVLVGLLIVLVAYFKLKSIWNKKRLLEKDNELLESQKLIASCQNSIRKLEELGMSDIKKIETLKKRVDRLQSSKDAYSYKKVLLYQLAMKGQSIANWNKPEMMAFLDCYASENVDYSLSLEEEGCYTPRQKVFLILLHEGMDENKIAEMMGLSNAALRTMKSRINGAKTKKR